MANIMDWIRTPKTQYRSVQDVHFPPYHPVMPHLLPPSSMDFSAGPVSKSRLAFLPALQTIANKIGNRKQV